MIQQLISLGDLLAQRSSTLRITEAAAEHVRRLAGRNGAGDAALRVFVIGTGCAGLQYGMALAGGAEPGDAVLDGGEVRLIVDHDSLVVLGGAVIDLAAEGLILIHPRAQPGCGCGDTHGCRSCG